MLNLFGSKPKKSTELPAASPRVTKKEVPKLMLNQTMGRITNVTPTRQANTQRDSQREKSPPEQRLITILRNDLSRRDLEIQKLKTDIKQKDSIISNLQKTNNELISREQKHLNEIAHLKNELEKLKAKQSPTKTEYFLYYSLERLTYRIDRPQSLFKKRH